MTPVKKWRVCVTVTNVFDVEAESQADAEARGLKISGENPEDATVAAYCMGEATPTANVRGMLFDSFKLGYTRHGDSLRVHYPIFMGGDEVTYAAGFTFDPHPEILAKPDSERAKLWKEMLEGAT